MSTKNKGNYRVETINNTSEWDALVRTLPLSNLYLSSIWGEYKARKGWNLLRLKIVNDRGPEEFGLVQLQSKNKFGITIYNIQGGVQVCSNNQSEELLSSCFDALKKFAGNISKFWALFVSYESMAFQEAEISMLKMGLSPVLTKSMYTYLINCNPAHEKQSLSVNWRHNLTRAQKNELLSVRWVESEADRIESMRNTRAMYEDLVNRKGFVSTIDLSLISDLIVADKNMWIVEALLDGKVVAARIGYACSNYVLDFLAASGDSAKNCYANYLLVWEMICRTGNAGKEKFDAGGIDPSGNSGVFNFKKGLGGSLSTNGPIWILASHRVLLNFVRYWMQRSG